MNNGRNWWASAPITVNQSRSDAEPEPKRLLTWLAHVVPIVGSLILWAIAIALLPPDMAAAAVIALVLGAWWLCGPRNEQVAVRLLAQGAPISRGQEALLQPAIVRLEEAGLAPQRLYVTHSRRHRVPAEPIGRHSTVLAPRLLAGAARGSVDAETLAVVLAHAEARRAARFGMPHDIALRITLVPGQTISSLLRGLARRLRWVPGAGVFWLIASVVITTAVWRTFAEGVWWVGLIIVLTASATLASHSARALWIRQVDAAADRSITDRGLGDPLRFLLLSDGSRRSLDRAESVGGRHDAPAAPIRRLRIVSDSSV